MKYPMQRNSEALSRAMRRDMMVGTAALILIESGLAGAATVMSGASPEPNQSETGDGADDASRQMRPIGGSDGLPDTHVGMAAGLHSVPEEIRDDDYRVALGYGLDGAGIGRSGGYVDGTTIMLTNVGSIPHHAAGGFGGGIARPPQWASSGSAGSQSEPAAEPASRPPATPQDMNVKLGTDDDDVILGSDADDYVFAGNGADQVLGGGGNDRLLGGKGDDVLLGGAGEDLLVGDKGDDKLTGGSGADTFFFRAGFGHDTITDFRSNGELDVIEVAKGEFADFAALASHLSDTDLGAVLTLHDGSTLTLSHVEKANLTAADFHFGV